MKKLYFIISGLLFTSGAFAQSQLPEERVILDYDKVLPVSSSVGDKASSGRNINPSGINESKLSGKYTHRNQWITENQQCGYKNTEFIKDGYIDLRYYTGIEYKAYVPAETKAGLFNLELRSDGPDFGPGDPSIIISGNNERQFIAYTAIPCDSQTNEPYRDQWFKIEHSNIISNRKLGTVAFGYRRGEMPTTSAQEIVYFDDFIMKLKKSVETCLFRETFFLLAKENSNWENNPNAEIVQYPGTSWSVIIETGADRWVSGYEPKTDLISLKWEDNAHDHILVLDKGLPEIVYENIDVAGFINLKLAFDVKEKTPKVEYKLDGNEWISVNIGTLYKTWTSKSFDISATGAKKVSLRISGKEIAAGAGFLDNLTIYGTDAPVGLMNACTSNVNIYPNPVKNILNVSCDSQIDKIELYSANGNLVYTGQAGNGVDVSNLNAGIYAVKVFTTEGISSAKVMKQ